MACTHDDATLSERISPIVPSAVHNGTLDPALGSRFAVVAAGHANPSLPRRIRDYLDDHPGEKIVLCLDAKEFEEYEGRRRAYAEGVPKTAMLHLVLADVQRRNAVRPDICIVAGGRDIVDLMPDVGAAPTIEMAIAQLLRG
jgi:hypothetical protein